MAHNDIGILNYECAESISSARPNYLAILLLFSHPRYIIPFLLDISKLVCVLSGVASFSHRGPHQSRDGRCFRVTDVAIRC